MLKAFFGGFIYFALLFTYLCIFGLNSAKKQAIQPTVVYKNINVTNIKRAYVEHCYNKQTNTITIYLYNPTEL